MRRLAKIQRSQLVSPMLQMDTMRQSAPQKTILENYVFRISIILPTMIGSVPSRITRSVRYVRKGCENLLYLLLSGTVKDAVD